jgi:putative DNA primase/helicase
VNWSNYDDVLGQMRGIGLLVDGLEVGRLRRCKVDGDREKRGWYSLHELTLDGGECVIVGSFGIWRGTEWNTQKVELKRSPLSADQRAALKARIAADMKAAEARRRGEASRAAMRAQKVWELCARDGDAPYLRRKGVQAHGVRFSPSGAVVIPMLDTSARVHGLQFIHAEKRQGRDKDFWPAGLAKQGHYHWIGPTPTSVMIVAEGYATGASVFEASGWPVAVAFDAGNLIHVAQALAKRYKGVQILIAADDDFKTFGNPGISKAEAAALAVGGAWFAPVFSQPAEVAARAAVAAIAPLPGAPGLTQAENAAAKTAVADAIKAAGAVGGTDFNDLHVAEGLHVARAQVEAKLRQLGWLTQAAPKTRAASPQGSGEDEPDAINLRPIETVDELLPRFSLVYGQGGTVFDHEQHRLVALSDMRDICLQREIHRAWMEHPDRHIVKVESVGFDPACTDPAISCNLWGGWPTTPKAGKCEALLDLLRYMCANDENPAQLFWWVLCWLAFPIQNPGAKMKTTIVVHGPQGTGKNLFFEAYMTMFGPYGRVIDQSAIEDRFNDWASRKLFLIADEVVARSDLYHIKNKLKAFITGDWIRINPKGLQAYDERNHVNMVFLSNEAQPVILEEDDRRHAVIYTPEKLSPAFYADVRKEIAEGGVAALHDYLLNLDLGDFEAGTLPPNTKAKRTLVALSMDSPERFMHAFKAGDVDGFPGEHRPALLLPALNQDLFDLYCAWCNRQGVRSLSQPKFLNKLETKFKAVTARKRLGGGGNPQRVLTLPGAPERPEDQTETDWLEFRISVFKQALRDFKAAGFGGSNHG